MPADLREDVSRRAEWRCEYCHAPEAITGIRYHIDHVYPVAKGGGDELENRALSCPTCNLAKADKTKLFNPRTDSWDDHFIFDPETLQVLGLTPIGKATVKALNMNAKYQLVARRLWVSISLYP